MAKKYENFSVGENLSKENEGYEEGDYIKVKNSSNHEQLTYLRIFDSVRS